MSPKAIQRSLYVAASGLAVAYVALWWLLGTLTPTPSLDVLSGTLYEVVAVDGDSHVLGVDSPDPAQPLAAANERFGEIQSMRRIERDEAVDILRRRNTPRHGVLLLLVFPALFVAAASHIGRRERRLDAVVEAIQPTLSEHVPELLRRTGLEEAALRNEVERIRRRGIAELTWDTERDRVYDERLSSYSITLQACPHCNDPIHVRIRADLTSVPQCTSCMTVFDESVLARMNQPLVARLAAEPVTPTTTTSLSLRDFALWTLLFPPVALVRALRAAR